MADLLNTARKLDYYDISLRKERGRQSLTWSEVQLASKALADELRVRVAAADASVEDRTQLGESTLPRNLSSLLRLSLSPTDGVPHEGATLAVYELLRVVANLCMDHDPNRRQLLDAGFITVVSDMLKSYWNLMSSPAAPSSSRKATAVKTDDIKVVKTAFGSIINLSMDFEPGRTAVIKEHIPGIILRLSTRIYPPGAWTTATTSSSSNEKALNEEWTWRCGLSQWAWKALESLDKGGGSLFGADDVPYLTENLLEFILPFPKSVPELSYEISTRSTMIDKDLEVLEYVSSYFEGLPLDADEVQTSLLQTTVLETIVQFVEDGSPPSYLQAESYELRERWQKSFGLAKGGIVNTLVNLSGEDKSIDVLWLDTDGEVPGGWLVQKMVDWVSTQSKALGSDRQRDDLVLCATLVLGNLGRRESRCNSLVFPPVSIVPHLVRLLRPDTDLKVKHGILALLRHLSQAKSSKLTLSEAGVIQAISQSKVWDQSADMAEVIQMSAIGVAKHLCASSVSNSLHLFSNDSIPSGIVQIIELIHRTDTFALQSEGTRVLGNIIKSLWSGPGVEYVNQAERKRAMKTLTNDECADAIAEMVGRSRKYPVLLNEGVVALTLMATYPDGALSVLRALAAPLGPEEPAPRSSTGNSTSNASISTPLDMLRVILSAEGMQYRPELKANVCTLLGETARHLETEGAKTLREDMRSTLEFIAKAPDSSSRELVKTAANAALEIWI